MDKEVAKKKLAKLVQDLFRDIRHQEYPPPRSRNWRRRLVSASLVRKAIGESQELRRFVIALIYFSRNTVTELPGKVWRNDGPVTLSV